MADRWLTATYVDSFVGQAVRVALCTEDTTYSSQSFNYIAEAATSRIQSALRNSGYDTLSTASTTTMPVLLMGCVGIWMDIAFSRPDKRLPLPQNWDTHMCRVVAAEILSGDIMLDSSVDESQAIGGVLVSEYDEDVTSTDGSRAAIFTRKNMVGY